MGPTRHPFKWDTGCSLPSVISENVAKTIRTHQGIRSKKVQITVDLGVGSASCKCSEILQGHVKIKDASRPDWGEEIGFDLEMAVLPGKSSTILLGAPTISALGANIGHSGKPTEGTSANPVIPPQDQSPPLVAERTWTSTLMASVGLEMWRAGEKVVCFIEPQLRFSFVYHPSLVHRDIPWRTTNENRQVSDSIADLIGKKVIQVSARAITMIRTIDEYGTAKTFRNVEVFIANVEQPIVVLGLDAISQLDDLDSIAQRELIVTGFTPSRDERVAQEVEDRKAEAEERGCPAKVLLGLEQVLKGLSNLRLDLEPGDPPAEVPAMHIPLKKGVDDTSHPRMYYPKLTTEQKEWLPEHLEKLTKAGVIVKIDDDAKDGSYSPTLLVAKKKRGEWRLVTDNRHVNSIVREVEVDIPDLDELRASIGRINSSVGPATRYATMDIVKGYWMIPVEKDSQKYLRFKLPSPFGAFRFARATMGFKRSGNYFIAQVQRILSETIIAGRVIVGTDDIAVLGRQRTANGKTISADDDLLESFRTVVTTLQRSRVPISPSPSSLTLWGRSAKWCGFILTEGTIQVDPERLNGLTTLIPPRTGAELIRFIGAASWIRSHVPDYPRLIAPLNAFKTKMFGEAKRRTKAVAARIILRDVGWDNNMDDAFKEIQDNISRAVVRFPRDPACDLVLFTDASQECWSGFLVQLPRVDDPAPLQERDDMQPIAFYGRQFVSHETRWHIPDKEAAAILYSLRRAHSLVGGRGIRIVTDARNLSYAFKNDFSRQGPQRQRILRWRQELLAYDYSIEHIPGEANVWADLMTRQFAGSTPPEPNVTYYCRNVHFRKPIILPDTKAVVEAQKALTTTERHGARKIAGLWKFRNKTLLPKTHPIVTKFLVCAHQGSAGHRGAESTLRNLSGYTWCGKGEDVKRFVAECLSCQLAADGTKVPRPLGRQMISDRPYKILSMDFLKMPVPADGRRWVLVIKDRFSRLIDTSRYKSADAYAAAEGLSKWLRSRPLPEWILSDGGSHFTSTALKALTQSYRIEHRIRTPYNSESSGAIENANRQILAICRRMTHEFGLDIGEWPRIFDAVIYACNHSHLPSLASRTPVEMSTSFKSKSVTELPVISMDEANKLQVKKVNFEAFARNVDEIREQFQKMFFPRVTAIDDRRHRANAKTRAVKAKAANFNIGEFVLVAVTGVVPKTGLRWSGVFEITDVIGSTSLIYKVRRVTRSRDKPRGPESLVHASRLRRFDPGQDGITAEIEAISWDGLTYQVDRIIKVRPITIGRKRTFEFQVRWRGFEACSDTHEPLESLYAHVPTLIQDFVRKGTRLTPDQEEDLQKALSALKIRKDASPNASNSIATAVTTATYGAELHSAVNAD